MTVITMITDFGSDSPSAGQLAGSLWTTAPGARLVELTHEIPQRDILTAQVVLENASPYFPDGSVHLVLVGLGPTLDARPLVARLGKMLFAGPDNGLITPLLERAEINRWTTEVYHANNPQYWQSPGAERAPIEDIYAPLAGHLARGIPLAMMGERINDPLRVSIPAPEMIGSGWRAQVVQVDSFGNLAVNLRRAHLEGMGMVRVGLNGQVIAGLSATFGDAQPGELIALFDSSNRLSICVVNGSAAEQLNAHPGDTVEVYSTSS